MRITLRATLTAIVAASAAAFLVLTLASDLLTRRVERELINIQERYVPKVELGPRLDAQFERIHRGFQDAVAAHDAEALAATREVKNDLLSQLATARDVVSPADAAALSSAIEEYFSATHDVSRRLIAGETGEPVLEAMAEMQRKQIRAAEFLKKSTTFDKSQLGEAFSAANRALTSSGRIRLGISMACLALVILLSVLLTRGVLHSLSELAAGLKRFAKGDFGQPVVVAGRNELGEVAQQANEMALSLSGLIAQRDRTDWLKGGLASLAQELRGELEPAEVAGRAIRLLARYLDAPVGALYYFDQEHVLRLLGQYALSVTASEGKAIPSFRSGEGLVGQAALQDQLMLISDPPADYLRVRSGLGEGSPRVVVLLPLIHSGQVTGVLELALFKPWPEVGTELLVSLRETLAIAIEVALARAATRELLAETQRQAQRLATQEEELRTSNEELQAQQEELRESNEELKNQAEELETQRRILEEKNLELNETRRHLEKKAKELTSVSAYKSQFLANMSHELRTPLNSMLLLSNLLAENETGRLTDKQVEFARTIYSAGKDLLALINQVLDLAKVEAGKKDVLMGAVALRDLADHARRVFEPLAQNKGLLFVTEVEPGLPLSISTDEKQVKQILNNLLANAIKFTERGQVALRFQKPEPGHQFHRHDFQADQIVALTVSDTGIGIAPENQERIFARFEQAQASTDRRYGGTGLGLTIARELASLLGGELQLRSAPGEGSTFTCFLPCQGPMQPAPEAPSGLSQIQDDKNELLPAESYFLLIEDDPVFANTVGEVIHDQGFKYVVALNGRTGLQLAKEGKPSGIILDVNLPDIDGWNVMKELQADPGTATIPVHFVSALDGAERGAALGAVGYLTKPVTKGDLIRAIGSLMPKAARAPRILVVEEDGANADSLLQQLTGANFELYRATNGREALEALQKERFGCMVLDISPSQTDGVEFLRSVQKQCGAEMPSVVVHAARALSKDETKQLQAYADAVVLKEGPSTERLINEIRLFVRRFKENLGSSRKLAPRPHPADVQLAGRKLLLVEDDMRTLYALSATLRAKGMNVLVADTGRSALNLLAEHPDVEAVLMDIMLPEMDGYEAMRQIRQNKRFGELPIIALTAKAMKGDKETCLEAGASDYLPKPIDGDRLLAMLRSCLSRKSSDGES
jgi:CheY-like chemotaxis protein/signal transduction histidine kinase